MKIITSHDQPPIPVRDMDWSAHTDNYEASYEEGTWMSNEPIGHGRTEQAAVSNLLELLEDDGRFGELVTAIRSERETKGQNPDTGVPVVQRDDLEQEVADRERDEWEGLAD